MPNPTREEVLEALKWLKLICSITPKCEAQTLRAFLAQVCGDAAYHHERTAKGLACPLPSPARAAVIQDAHDKAALYREIAEKLKE